MKPYIENNGTKEYEIIAYSTTWLTDYIEINKIH